MTNFRSGVVQVGGRLIIILALTIRVRDESLNKLELLAFIQVYEHAIHV